MDHFSRLWYQIIPPKGKRRRRAGGSAEDGVRGEPEDLLKTFLFRRRRTLDADDQLTERELGLIQGWDDERGRSLMSSDMFLPAPSSFKLPTKKWCQNVQSKITELVSPPLAQLLRVQPENHELMAP